MRRSPVLLASLLAAAMAVGACSGGVERLRAGGESKEKDIVGRGEKAAGASEASDLRAMLQAAAPAGFEPAARSGAFGMAEELNASEDPIAERARLLRHGFTRGYRAGWSRAADMVLAVVYELRDEVSARSFEQEENRKAFGDDGEPFDVPEVSGATGVSTVQPSGETTYYVRQISFTVGRHVFGVAYFRGDRQPPVEEARRLAAALARAAR